MEKAMAERRKKLMEEEKKVKEAMEHVKHKIAVFSGKGGDWIWRKLQWGKLKKRLQWQ